MSLQGKRTPVKPFLKKLQILVEIKKLGVKIKKLGIFSKEPVKVLIFLFLFFLVAGDKRIHVLDFGGKLQELSAR
jgi:hypothetical protein